MKGVSCVDQLSSVKSCPTNVHTVVQNLHVGTRLNQFWKTWDQLQGYKNPQGRLNPPFPELTSFDQVSSDNKLLCQSPQEWLPGGCITCTYSKECSRKGHKSDIPCFLQQTILGSKPKQPMETYSRSEDAEQISEIRNIQNGDTIRTSLQKGEWVTSIDFMDAYFHIPINPPSRKYLQFHVQGQSYQFKMLHLVYPLLHRNLQW